MVIFASLLFLKLYVGFLQPVTKFNTFMVEDRPGEQWVTLRRKFGEDEHIKIEATMIDGAITIPKGNDENLGEDVRLHISVLVDIWKGEGSDFLEFVCSSWPNSLEIQKVYLLRSDSSRAQPYMGPNVKYEASSYFIILCMHYTCINLFHLFIE